MGLDYLLLLAEIRKLRRELTVQIDGLTQPFDESASTAAFTTATNFSASPIADNWGLLFDGGENSDEQHYEVPIVADDWGGLFDGGDDSVEQHYEVSIVVDSWGGLFEQPAHATEDHELDLDVFSSAQIRNEHGLTSIIPVALLDVIHEPAPMLDATSTDSEFSGNEVGAPSTGQIHDEKVLPSTGNEVVDMNQFAQQVAECSGYLVARAEQEKRVAAVPAKGPCLDRLSILPDTLHDNIVSRLLLKDAARTAVL